MTAKRFFKRMWEEEYYIFDSQAISENEFDEKVEYEGYHAFADSMMGDEVVNRLNEQHETIEDLKDVNVRCCNEYNQFHKRMMELEKENEQLKSDKEHLMGCLIRFFGYDDEDIDYNLNRESNREYGKQYYSMKEETKKELEE